MPDAPELPTEEQLARLDDAVAALPDGIDDAKADALVAGAFSWAAAAGVKRPRSKLAFAAGMVLGAAVAGGGLSVVLSRPVVRWGADVDVRTGPESSAVVGTERGTMFVPRNSRVLSDTLFEGGVLLQGSGFVLSAGNAKIVADGKVFVSLEPADRPSRVMPPWETTGNGWMMLGPPGAVRVYTAAVFVIEGSATVSTALAARVTVNAGETWNAKDKVVSPALRAPRAADPPREPDVAEVSREQLLARIEVLRNEKEQLLRERAAQERSLEVRDVRSPYVDRGSTGKSGDRNYFVLTPEELKASAAKGELRLRIPLGDAPQLKVEDQAAAAVGINAEERRAIDALYVASKQRMLGGLRKLYQEIGGTQQVAFELSDDSLLREIRMQSLKGEFSDAIRQLANERAGLAPKKAPGDGPAVLRAFRLCLDEDDRFVADVTALLGSRRAEAFLNHSETSHADNVFGVGPPKK